MRLFKICLSATFLLLVTSAYADIAVIVNKGNSVDSLSSAEVSRLFLKKKVSFPNGVRAMPIDLEDPGVKQPFYESVARKNESQLKSYWARMVFSGKAQPPKSGINAAQVKSLVAENEGALAFIDSKDVDGSVKVILTIK